MTPVPSPTAVLEQKIKFNSRQRVELFSEKVDVAFYNGSATLNWSFEIKDVAPYVDENRIYPGSGFILLAVIVAAIATIIFGTTAAASGGAWRGGRIFLSLVLPPAAVLVASCWLYRRMSWGIIHIRSLSTGNALLSLRADRPDSGKVSTFLDALLAKPREDYSHWLNDVPGTIHTHFPLEIERFHKLMTDGVISAEEFAAKKSELIMDFMRG